MRRNSSHDNAMPASDATSGTWAIQPVRLRALLVDSGNTPASGNAMNPPTSDSTNNTARGMWWLKRVRRMRGARRKCAPGRRTR